MTKSANVSVNFSVHDDKSQSGLLATSEFDAQINFALALGEGVGAAQFNLAYMAERTLATGATDSIDLAGVLTDAFGATITAVEVVAIVIMNRQKDGTANTTTLTIGGGSNPIVGFATAVLDPGSIILLAGGDASGAFVVTAATGDLLQIVNSAGATNKYMIGVLARNA